MQAVHVTWFKIKWLIWGSLLQISLYVKENTYQDEETKRKLAHIHKSCSVSNPCFPPVL
jgi:hypothetical protein